MGNPALTIKVESVEDLAQKLLDFLLAHAPRQGAPG
jgi:hypothetical protein